MAEQTDRLDRIPVVVDTGLVDADDPRAVEHVTAAAYDQMAAEHDKAHLDSEEIAEIDKLLDEHLVPQLDESRTPVGGARRVELLVHERDMARKQLSVTIDRYHSALVPTLRECVAAVGQRFDDGTVGRMMELDRAKELHEWLTRRAAALTDGEAQGPSGDPWLDIVICDHLLSTGETCSRCAPEQTNTR